VTVSYSLEAGASWTIITAGVTNSGALAWKIPPAGTLQGLVKVEAADQAGHMGGDISDSVFTILAPDPAENRVYLPIIVKPTRLSALDPSPLPTAVGSVFH
jgi:hypothetical protein